MQVIQFFIPNSFRNFNYIVYDEKSRQGYSIDPFDKDLVIKHAKKHDVKLIGILNTHYHYDHVMNNKELAAELNIPIHVNDVENFPLGESYLEVIQTPGHTNNHVVFLAAHEGKQQFVIAGDTLFNAGVGNCKNGGDPETLFETTIKLNKLLDDDTVLYPGHDYMLTNLNFSKSIDANNKDVNDLLAKRAAMDLDHDFINTTMREERRINQFLMVDNIEAFLRLRLKRDNW
ncbi:hydroxyacylglutathione hydrolase family protein [Bacteriovoracaceae bacterium]|nr:hydroxyacylglutathione hydrolase family protein [Bacteriovoracaceae bacterium]